jgi:hypothetical protein
VRTNSQVDSEQLLKKEPLPRPFNARRYRAQVPLIEAPGAPGKQNPFLNVRGETGEAHNLRQPGARNMTNARNRGVIPDSRFADLVLESQGECQQASHAWNRVLRNSRIRPVERFATATIAKVERIADLAVTHQWPFSLWARKRIDIRPSCAE